jgi:hypothetical protein
MPNHERGVVRPPNIGLQGPQSKIASPIRLPDHSPQGPQSKIASPVRLPDNRFNVECAKMPQPPSVTWPGTGDIPIQPWFPDGSVNSARRIPDEPWAVRK